MKLSRHSASGGTLILTLLVVFVLVGLVGLAMNYTQQQARLTKRTELSNIAMEIGDGCLEVLFTHWRDIYRSTGALVLPTNYFYTTTYAPGARPTTPPPLIPEPSKAMFPDVPQNFTIRNFRVQAVTPMLNIKKDFPKYYINPADGEQSTVRDTDTAPPLTGKTTFYKDEEPRCFPGAFGVGIAQYSFYYLASADVSYPALGGKTVTSKVRRVFEKKFNTPWTLGNLFYNGDLELSPNSNLTINGKVHTNGNLYTGSNKLTLTDKTTFNGAWSIGYAPGDTMHTATPTAPIFPSNLPPGQDVAYLPFGWDAQKMFNLGDNNPNNEGYREIIERPVTTTGVTDPVSSQRYYNQADIKILVDANNNLEIRNYNNQVITPTSSNTNDKNIAQAVRSATTQNETFQDNREDGATVRVFTVDVSKITQAVNAGSIADPNGYGLVVYMSDTSATAANKRGVRIKNGSAIPANGMTFVSDCPLYVRGDFNTGTNPLSNSGDPTKPTASGYTRSTSAIIADSITLQSNNWADTNSTKALSGRLATNTTVNAALVAGNVPTANGTYSGGAENFVRFMEDWSGKRFTYYGSMVQLFPSQLAIGTWGKDNVYSAPSQFWYYDSNFEQKSPPGNLVLASYLQQQRWYLVY